MKKKILLLALSLTSTILATSCARFLDVQPEGTPSTTTYFSNDQQAIDAIDALYERFHQEALYGRELFWEQGAANDIVWGRSEGYSTLATFKYTGTESPLNRIFEALYTVISRSNWVVEKLLDKQKATPLTDVELRSLGEAYFTRAWAHFLVAYRYGLPEQGVPFSRYESFDGGYDYSIYKQQPSVMDNYKMIIEDMDKAVEYLPRLEELGQENRGRAHEAAAIAMKVKVYAYWATWDEAKWQQVISLVNELETTYGRGLSPKFDNLFSSDFSKWWDSEYIWTIPGTGGSQGGGSKYPGVCLENKGWGRYNGWGQHKPTLNIYEELLKDGEGNERLIRSILEYNQEFEFFGEKRRFFSSSDLEAGFQINKYMDAFKHKDPVENGYVNSDGNFMTTRLNFPIIRFAEMLLFRAEAYLMTNQGPLATADLNRIRRRSNLVPLVGNATMKDLYHERRCELAFECTDHLYDLKRWHRSSNAEIKALASEELNARPMVRHYADRTQPTSSFTIGEYQDYRDKTSYQDYMIVFPYNPETVLNSNGKLKQNPNYK